MPRRGAYGRSASGINVVKRSTRTLSAKGPNENSSTKVISRLSNKNSTSPPTASIFFSEESHSPMELPPSRPLDSRRNSVGTIIPKLRKRRKNILIESTNIMGNKLDDVGHDAVVGSDIGIDAGTFDSITVRSIRNKSNKRKSPHQSSNARNLGKKARKSKTRSQSVAAKVKRKSAGKDTGAGDEITPRISNRNKNNLRNKHRSTSIPSVYETLPLNNESPGPETHISRDNGKKNDSSNDKCNRSKMSNVTRDKPVQKNGTKKKGNPIKKPVERDRGIGQKDESDCDMDCSSDSIGMSSSDNDSNDKSEGENSQGEKGRAETIHEKVPGEPVHARTSAQDSSKSNLHVLTAPESNYNMIDAQGNPIVSKGLMERARESKADDEKLFQKLMQSCGGKPRQKLNLASLIDPSPDSGVSSITLSSATLLGATIPLERSGSLDSSVTMQTFDSESDGYASEINSLDVAGGACRIREKDKRRRVVSIQNTGIPAKKKKSRAAVKTLEANQNPEKSLISKQFYNNAKRHAPSKVKSVSREDSSSKRKCKDDDTVQTIDNQKRSVITHPKLPPGWQVKISKSKNLPYFVHPDFGSSWHCPVITRYPVEIRRYNDMPGDVDSRDENQSNSSDEEIMRPTKKGAEQKVSENDQNGGEEEQGDARISGKEKVKDKVGRGRQNRSKFPIYVDSAQQPSIDPLVISTEKRETSVQHSQQIEDKESLENILPNQKARQVLGGDNSVASSGSQLFNRNNDISYDNNVGNENVFIADNNEAFDFDTETEAEIEAGSEEEMCHKDPVNVATMSHAVQKNRSVHNKVDNLTKATIHQLSFSHKFSFAKSPSPIQMEHHSPRFLDFDQGIDGDSHVFESDKSEESPSHGVERKESSDQIVHDDSGQPGKNSNTESLTARLRRLRHPICSLQRLDEIIAETNIQKKLVGKPHRPSLSSRKKKRGKVTVTIGRRKMNRK